VLSVAGRAGLEVLPARNLELLHRGDDHFRTLRTAIANARREISIEMYQIRPDPVGWAVCTALAEAALRGVTVRLLLDSFGSGHIAGWFRGLRSHGIEIRWFNHWRPWRSPFRRTHRKLVVIDGRIASIGGINMAAEFSERHSGRSSWRDAALWMEGPVVWLLRRQFEAAWQRHGGSPGPPLEVPSGGGTPCAVCGGRDAVGNHGPTYVAMAELAERELLLATPYFLPDRRFRQALVNAVGRGVRVVVVVPRRSDLPWFKHGSRLRYQQLLDEGVEIWERCDRMIHAKVAVVDGRMAAIGSANLNRLSFYGNSETLLLTGSPAVVEGINSLIAAESASVADRIDGCSWPTHPDRSRLSELISSTLGLVF
jgi:phosphatidylserine/phosphatidylglycerophosphate/cardiolipin synthase-like enzyme